MVKAIDYWCNPFTEETAGHSYKHPEIEKVIKWWHLEDQFRPFTPEEIIARLDEAGIEKVLIPNFQQRSYVMKDMISHPSVEDLVKLLNTYPDRFLGLYGINPYKRMDGVRELEKAVKEYNFKGAHLHTYGFELAINSKELYPYYAKCVELDVPVVMQIGHSAEIMPSALAKPILLDDIAIYFPELRIVAAHTGWPWVDELVAMAWKHPNVYIGTSAHMPRYWPPALVDFFKTRGKGKVLFGSDFPVLDHKVCMKQIDKMELDDDTKSLLLRDVAIKVFKL